MLLDEILEFILTTVVFVVLIVLIVGITYLSVWVFYRLVGRIQNLVKYIKRIRK